MSLDVRVIPFVLGTWGVILGLPVAAFLVLSSWISPIAAVAVSIALLMIGVFMAEWLARVMNRLLGYTKGQD